MTKTKIIGIVGSSKVTDDQCVDVIKDILQSYPNNTVFVTGDAFGIDFAVRKTCKIMKKTCSVIYSKTRYWDDGFKIRNEIIAKYCDKIISIALPFDKISCYHCNRDDHEKTAGCYTGKINGNYEVRILAD